MAIFLDDIPYMITQNSKRVALPQGGTKQGYGSIVFLYSNQIQDTIRMINNKTCYDANKTYTQYYYNLEYKGTLLNRLYNVRDVRKREEIYEMIDEQTRVKPHPYTMLNKTPNRNVYFDLLEYNNIFQGRMTSARSIDVFIRNFWSYYKSILFGNQTNEYNKRVLLINTDDSMDEGDEVLDQLQRSVATTLYYTMYKYLDLLKDMDIDIVFYSSEPNKVLKVNPSLLDKKSYIIFQREISKFKHRRIFDKSDSELKAAELKSQLKSSLMKSFNFIGDSDTVEDREALSKVEDIIEDISKKSTNNKLTQKELTEEDDNKLANALYDQMVKKTIPTKPVSSPRDAMLREKQDSLVIQDNLTLKKLQDMNVTRRTIPTKDISHAVKTLNDNMKTVKFPNINKDYIENIMTRDIMNTFTSLNDKSYKFHILNVEYKETSNELNYKDTLKVTLEDSLKQRHIVTVDIPKFLENKFLYLGGNKKVINKQNFFIPVVKTGPDTVQVVTNYNKMFIRRTGDKSISSVERMMKLVSDDENMLSMFDVGNNSAMNKIYVTTLEYDEYSKIFTKFKGTNTTLFFNQKSARQYADEHNISITDEQLFIGVKNNKPIYIDVNTQIPNIGKSITDLIFSELPQEKQEEHAKIRSTKRLKHNTVTIMSQTIPLVALLLYWEGITSLLAKMKLEYRFESKGSAKVAEDEAMIKFKDMYLIYKEDISNSLMLNGIKALDTSKYEFADFDLPETYMTYFKKVYGNVNISNAISNFYEWIIDPETKEILEDLKMPTDIVSLCIYANNLLCDDNCSSEVDENIMRIRSTSIIPAILYNEVSRAYLLHKNSMGKKKLSMPRDAVIKQLLALQTVEDYSTLNPVVELEKDRAISSKGFRGVNMDRAYTEEKRSYDPSMLGIIGMSTSPDGNVGINRFLTMEPNIVSARGFVDIKDKKLNELKDSNLFSPAELLYPLGNTRDDAIRTAMAGKQSKHVIPIKNATPALITNGADEAIRFHLSSDFTINADDDGEVIDYDQASKTLMIKYKNGTHRAISLAPTIVKNGGGGFFLSNEIITPFKVGDKFKKDDALAWHKDFFQTDDINGTRMNVGSLTKVAIMSSYATYNDSTLITHKLAEDTETSMTFAKSAVIGKNSNVYNIKKIGDHIEIGDPLLSYDTSFDDSDLNKLLSSLSDSEKNTLEEVTVQNIKSKYSGKIIDIKIYSTVELDDMSPSLAKIVNEYYKKINARKKFISKYDNSNSVVKCGLLLNETTGVVEPNIYGMIKGEYVKDSVLIEFYIEHADLLGVGDKLAYFTALKSVVGEVIPKGYEPFSEYRPLEEVSSLIDPSAIQKRQVPSIEITVAGNKAMVEFKRALQKIYEE